MKKILLYSLVCVALLTPVVMNWDEVKVLVVQAKCRSFCKAQNKANDMWSKFTGGAQSSGGAAGMEQPFGGSVGMIFPCTANLRTAYMMKPVAGVAGPYAATPLSLRSYGMLYPGNNVLGSSQSGGECRFYVGPYIFTFPVEQTVSITPGVGTSMGAGM